MLKAYSRLRLSNLVDFSLRKVLGGPKLIETVKRKSFKGAADDLEVACSEKEKKNKFSLKSVNILHNQRSVHSGQGVNYDHVSLPLFMRYRIASETQFKCRLLIINGCANPDDCRVVRVDCFDCFALVSLHHARYLGRIIILWKTDVVAAINSASIEARGVVSLDTPPNFWRVP